VVCGGGGRVKVGGNGKPCDGGRGGSAGWRGRERGGGAETEKEGASRNNSAANIVKEGRITLYRQGRKRRT